MPLREGAGRPMVGADSETKYSDQLNCSALLSRFLLVLSEDTRRLPMADGVLGRTYHQSQESFLAD